MKRLVLKDWAIMQDIHDIGESTKVYEPGWDPDSLAYYRHSAWEPIDRLAHLQLLISESPYFGHKLRFFNNAPWWYKCVFNISENAEDKRAVLRFEGVDYYCKIWINGNYIGEHEGYFSPFEFDVTGLIYTEKENTLAVKVWSPWDPYDETKDRFSQTVIRHMVKGIYEHADTFIQRDVNPVGIWNDVSVNFYGDAKFSKKIAVGTKLTDENKKSSVSVSIPVSLREGCPEALLRCELKEKKSGKLLDTAEKTILNGEGDAAADIIFNIDNPKLWNTWDRGDQNLYLLSLILFTGENISDRIEEEFGVRTVDLVRTQNETTYYLNGKRLYIRGTTYFPDIYLSELHEQRYHRDLQAIKNAGMNAVRIHVHVQRPEFYNLCDEYGIAVIQDFDFCWNSKIDAEWTDNAVKIFGDMVSMLRNHPSLFTWICMNEPKGGVESQYMNEQPRPQLYEAARRLTPNIPAIKGSQCNNDMESGDSHNYSGSLDGEKTLYTDIYTQRHEKFNTEFGMDAPPCIQNQRQVPRIYQRLKPLEYDIDKLQQYQYRLLKYYIEHYRITKYKPCAGYMQFMFIDLCPQSFYGVYDWWGTPKKGLNALFESNQPIGIFMEYLDKPEAIWIANDLLCSYPGCCAEWTVTDDSGRIITESGRQIDVPEDSIVKVCDFNFRVEKDVKYMINLVLSDANGNILTENRYDDPFNHPNHPKGHPLRACNELGMRLFWA